MTAVDCYTVKLCNMWHEDPRSCKPPKCLSHLRWAQGLNLEQATKHFGYFCEVASSYQKRPTLYKSKYLCYLLFQSRLFGHLRPSQAASPSANAQRQKPPRWHNKCKANETIEPSQESTGKIKKACRDSEWFWWTLIYSHLFNLSKSWLQHWHYLRSVQSPAAFTVTVLPWTPSSHQLQNLVIAEDDLHNLHSFTASLCFTVLCTVWHYGIFQWWKVLATKINMSVTNPVIRCWDLLSHFESVNFSLFRWLQLPNATKSSQRGKPSFRFCGSWAQRTNQHSDSHFFAIQCALCGSLELQTDWEHWQPLDLMLRGLLQVACPFLGCYMLLPILSQDPAGCPQVSCWSPLCFWIRSTSCQTMSEWLRHFDESNPCGRSKWRQRNYNCTFHW